MSDRRAIVLCDADLRWPSSAAAESASIVDACTPHVRLVEHIGSTAVPRLIAKPVIDLMPALKRFEDGFACIGPMERLGYTCRGEYGIAGRHYFVRGEPRLFHVHMFVLGSEAWRHHLLFRDYLRMHADVAAEYASLKRELAARFRDDVHGYAAAKSDFCRKTVERAGGHTA